MGAAGEIMRRKFAALNAQDEAKMRSYFSHDAEKEVPGGVLHGSDQIAAFVAAFWEAFPNLKLTVTSEIEQGPVVAVRGRMTGTHSGTLRTPGGDIPATGRDIDLAFSDDYEVQAGLIVSSHLLLDRLALLEQLGVIPAPAPA
jgi:predicted ester cyclase